MKILDSGTRGTGDIRECMMNWAYGGIWCAEQLGKKGPSRAIIRSAAAVGLGAGYVVVSALRDGGEGEIIAEDASWWQ